MTRRRVAVTGLGLVSPYGGDPGDFFARLLAGESAIGFLRTEDVPRPLAMPFVACPGFSADAALGRALAGTLDRFAQLGVAAAFAAWDDAGFPRRAAAPDRESWGVTWGTALGGTLAYEKGYRDLWQRGRERLSPLSLILGLNNAANAQISIQLGLGGVSMSHTVACASSAIAIGEAFRRVRSGEAPVMVTGGSDAPQAYAVARAWEGLRVLASSDESGAPQSCRPFSVDRGGLVLGEGGAALVLEDWEHAVARGARIHGEMLGYGTTCDHSHLVRPEAAGQQRALEQALADAGLTSGDIDYINAHGSAPSPERIKEPLHVTRNFPGNRRRPASRNRRTDRRGPQPGSRARGNRARRAAFRRRTGTRLDRRAGDRAGHFQALRFPVAVGQRGQRAHLFLAAHPGCAHRRPARQVIMTPAKLLRGLALFALVAAWAWLAHQGSAGEGDPDFAAALATLPVVAIVVMLLWRAGNPLWMAGGGLAVLGLLAWLWPALRQNVALLYYVQHVGTNLALATLFGRSLLGSREALVTQFSRKAHGGVISVAKARYTRQVTIAWTIFFLATALLSTLLFWLAPPAAWSVFANLLTVPLILLMFAVEYGFRHRLLAPGDRSSVADTIRGYRAATRRGSDTLANHR